MILEKEFDSEIEMKITKSALNAVAEYKGIKLSCDYLTTVKEVIGDNYRLQAVLTILMTNAIRFLKKQRKQSFSPNDVISHTNRPLSKLVKVGQNYNKLNLRPNLLLLFRYLSAIISNYLNQFRKMSNE
ncbi:hypothetical protein ACA350_07595 [Orientia tsutsugamushi]|uniref:hypothetical protein n=1 Tax=Orientia tsutsugamushi TaxID=784 RepID=UPI003527A80F